MGKAMKRRKIISKTESSIRNSFEKIADLTAWKTIDQSTVEQFERAVTAEKASRNTTGRYVYTIKRFI
jgi:hypothetical protein